MSFLRYLIFNIILEVLVLSSVILHGVKSGIQTHTSIWRPFSITLANKSDTEKCSYLLLYIGQDSRDIYNTWVLTDDEKKRTKIILDKFEEYCYPRTNITMDRHIFFSRNQPPGETIDNYATNLR